MIKNESYFSSVNLGLRPFNNDREPPLGFLGRGHEASTICGSELIVGANSNSRLSRPGGLSHKPLFNPPRKCRIPGTTLNPLPALLWLVWLPKSQPPAPLFRSSPSRLPLSAIISYRFMLSRKKSERHSRCSCPKSTLHLRVFKEAAVYSPGLRFQLRLGL